MISPEPLASEVAQRLIAELDAELSSIYPPEANFFELAEEEVGEGRGVFLVARAGGAPVGCGALRCIDSTTAEVKRMYVRKAGRGKGAALAILAELESRARAFGVSRVLLETGSRQPEALGLYARAGYARVPLFGRYVGAPFSVCFGKDL